MYVSNSFTTDFTATENCKGYQRTADQPSRLNPSGLKEYFKWFQESSMGSMKSIVNLDHITESWNATSLSKISYSDLFGLALCFDISDLLENVI